MSTEKPRLLTDDYNNLRALLGQAFYRTWAVCDLINFGCFPEARNELVLLDDALKTVAHEFERLYRW